MKKKLLAMLLAFCMVVTLLPTVAFADGASAPAASISANGGQIELFGKTGDEWHSLALLTFDKDISTQTVEIAQSVSAIKVVKRSGYEANLDELTLDGVWPTGYERKLSATDNDLIEVVDETEFALSGSGTLTVSARAPISVVDKSCAFKFPESNLYHPVTVDSDFYSYTLGDNAGAFATGETLTVPDSDTLFYDEMAYPGTGHPAAPMQIYLADDGETLYAFFEAFIDNTFDHGKDYAAVHIKNGDAVKTFAVHTTEENEYGRWYFDYTDNAKGIAWQHMCYVITVPLSELENPTSALDVAFEYYGTSGTDTLKYLRIDGKQIGDSGNYNLPVNSHYINSSWEDAASGSWWLYNDNGSYTLTLNGANLTDVLYPWGNLNIVLTEGSTNTIGTESISRAIDSFGYILNISGRGTLNLFGKYCALDAGYATLIITDAAVNATLSNTNNEGVDGVSVQKLILDNANVTVTAANNYSAVGVRMSELNMTNSTLTVAASAEGSGGGYALRSTSTSIPVIITDNYAKYYEGDNAPGELVSSLTFTSSGGTWPKQQSKPYVRIVSRGGWLDTDTADKYIYADFSWTGSGSENDPYLIADAADLAGIAAAVNAYDRSVSSQAIVSSGISGNTSSAEASNFAGKYFKLTNNIDLEGRPWTPIGTGLSGSTFAGTFDGNAKTVEKLMIDDGSYCAGLFGSNSGVIDSLSVGVDSITAIAPRGSIASVGGLAGDNHGGTIRNCSVILAGDIIGKGGYNISRVGGLVGWNRKNEDSNRSSIIQNCFVIGSGTVTASVADINEGGVDTHAGGLVGYNDSSTIQNCYCAAGISVMAHKREDKNFAGALVGGLYSGTVSNCYYGSEAVVTPENAYGIGALNKGGYVGWEAVTTAVSGAIPMTDDDMKLPAFVGTLNANVEALGDPSLKQWIGTGSYPALMFKNPPVLSEFTVTQPSASSASGSIVPLVGTAELYEYSTDGGTTWTTLTSDSLATAGVNAYLIRYKATQSDPLTITINAYTPPSTGGGSTPPTYTVPVESGASSVNASATVSNGTAAISVNNSQLDDLLNGEDVSGIISIDAGLDKSIDTTAIPASVIDKIADAANDSSKDVTGLEVELDTGTVSLDAKALAAASEQAADNTISIHVKEIDKTGLTSTQQAALADEHADDIIVEVTIKSGNTVISNYNDGIITVTLPYELKEGEVASGVRVWHLASDGSLTLMECTYNEKTKTVSFVTDHLSDFIVGYDASAAFVNTFSDVLESDYFYDAVLWAVNEKITEGTGATTFSPADSCTRAQMATFLWRADGSPEPTETVNPFTDVNADAYYYKAVLWAVEKGITLGTNDDGTTFSPDDTCIRGQMATFLYRYAGSPTVTGSNPFTDVSASDYYCNAVIWAAAEDVTQGTSTTTFSPMEDCTRGQIVTFLYRIIV